MAGLALFAGGLSPFGGSPTAVSAETILAEDGRRRQQQRPGVPAPTSYHMVSRQRELLGGAERAVVDTENEVWYRDAGAPAQREPRR